MKNTTPLFVVVLIGLLLGFFSWLLPEAKPQEEQVAVPTSAESQATAVDSKSVLRSELDGLSTNLPDGSELELTITLRNVEGHLLSAGLVFLETENVELRKDSAWSKSGGDGLFHVPTPPSTAWIHAQAPGYWSKTVAWSTEDANHQMVELEAITTFQEIECLDFLTQQPVAGVSFQSRNRRSDRPQRWHGSVVSDTEGVVRFPRLTTEYFSVRILNGNAQGLIASQFEVSQFTETIPLFRRCETTLTVQDEEGAALGFSPVGADRFHLYHDQTPRANMDLPIQRATADESGQATLQLAIGVEQTVWASHPEYGLQKQTVTPSTATEEIVFSLPKLAPLVIAIDLPSGVAPSSVAAILSFRGSRRKEPLLRGEDGLFTLVAPSTITQVTFNAPGCQSLLGLLWDSKITSSDSVDQTTGFVRIAMQRGFDVAGKALRIDGSPAQVTCYLWEAEVDPPRPEPSERVDASAWTWMLAPPHAPLDTKPDGSFLFQGMPAGTYVLDVMIDKDQPSTFTALCTYVSEQAWITVPQDEPVTVILSQLEDCAVRVFDATTQESVKRFDLQRKSKEDGMFGLSGDSSNGLVRGWLPVDELDDILVKADGYIYTELQTAEINSSQSPWQLRVALQPITPGSITAIFDLPLAENTTPNASAAADGPVLIGVSTETPTRWSEYYDLRSGQAQSLSVPVASSTVLEFYVRDRKLREKFRVEPEFVTYLPGQDITITLIPLEDDER